MTDATSDTRADTTREQILLAAARQFSSRPYHEVGLDDILADAELTKGAMYFHFKSKHALAMAIIDQHTTAGTLAVQELHTRGLSGLETLVDFSYLLATREINQPAGRAGLHLLETVGWAGGLQSRLLAEWIDAIVPLVQRAIAEGDLTAQSEPLDVARLLMSVYLGLRHTSSLDEPDRFLLDLERAWGLLLAGIATAERAGYFTQFIRRRTALASKASKTAGGGA